MSIRDVSFDKEGGFMNTKTYEINSTTCALISQDNFTTIIIDNNGKHTINSPIDEVLDYSCGYYGSSLKGRLEGTKHILGSKYKLPIIIEETKEIIFFPTTSIKNNKCVWLSLKNISDYQKKDSKLQITFKNKISLTLNISYESFENQILRATKLLLIIKNRKK